MPRFRIILFLASFALISIIGFFAVQYAQGFRFDIKSFSFTQKGILVATSTPDAAQVFINSNLKTATNSNLSLVPGIYDVQISKEGFTSWSKRLTVAPGIVTKTNALLFPKATTLSPLTFFGASKPVISPNGTKLAWVVPAGIWVLDLDNLPFGFTREARQVSDLEVGGGVLSWSPDSRNLLLERPNGTFLIEPGTFTKQGELVNLTGKRLEETRLSWQKYEQTRTLSQLKRVPETVADILQRKTSKFQFSPDESKVLYTASSAGLLAENLIPPLAGSSTQKQERAIKQGQTYVYDIKEDRNFWINGAQIQLSWFPTSRHLILPEKDKISILEYDGTNKTSVWAGAYEIPFVFANISGSELVILTNLGATNGELSNLYTINLR